MLSATPATVLAVAFSLSAAPVHIIILPPIPIDWGQLGHIKIAVAMGGSTAPASQHERTTT
jgi:hypothetical protein